MVFPPLLLSESLIVVVVRLVVVGVFVQGSMFTPSGFVHVVSLVPIL